MGVQGFTHVLRQTKTPFLIPTGLPRACLGLAVAQSVAVGGDLVNNSCTELVFVRMRSGILFWLFKGGHF